MLGAWRRTSVHNSVPDRMSVAFQDAAVSITITSITDMLSFWIGIITPFPCVKIFCIYTGKYFHRMVIITEQQNYFRFIFVICKFYFISQVLVLHLPTFGILRFLELVWLSLDMLKGTTDML